MKFYLCDDDLTLHPKYEKMIVALCKKHGIECEFFSYSSGEQLLFSFEEQEGFPGVLFLDISMPEMDGIAVADALQKLKTRAEIIFLTMSKKHFLLAFDVKAFNYIVKDETSAARFEKVFLEAVKASKDKQEEFLLFSCGGERRSVPVEDIYYFSVNKRIVTVHYKNDDSFSFISTIGQIEDSLYGKGFVRVNRSFLVATRYIERLAGREVWLRNGLQLSVGRKYYPDLQSALRDIASN